MNMTQTQGYDIDAIIASGKDFRNKKMPGADFSGKDLRNADFRNASLQEANFAGANVSYAKFNCANLIRANFDQATCYMTNFENANLSFVKLTCTSLFGITITLKCESFQGLELNPGDWAGWLMYGLIMKPPSKEQREKLIMAMGLEYWEVLRKSYAVRNM